MNAGARDRWQILIVEDDPEVAFVYKRALQTNEDFEVRGVVVNGEDALAFLSRWPCDLMLLDLRLAGMNGVALIRQLREAKNPIEVIALTANRSTAAVRAVVQAGAIDYLVKPFSIDRLHQSLASFNERASALRANELDQPTVDRICAAGREPRRWLPKGLNENGVEKVREALRAQSTEVSAADVADATGLARVTARRYLEYLVSSGQAGADSVAAGTGRPRKMYRAAVGSASR